MASVLPIVFVIAAGLCLSLVLLALWQSLRGLLVRSPSALSANVPHDARRDALLREKHELLTAIRDVRFEHELGKVSDADFQRMEQGYRARAREVLRELDEQIAPYRAQARALLERAGAQPPAAVGSGNGRPATAASAEPEPPAPVVATDVARRGCPQCGAGNDTDAVFCKRCGARLQSEATA